MTSLSVSRWAARRVFFIGEPPFGELLPQGGYLDGDAVFGGESGAHLGQGEVGPSGDPGADGRLEGCDPRLAVPADGQAGGPAAGLHPGADLMDPDAADLEPARDIGGTVPASEGAQHPVAEVLRIGLHGRTSAAERGEEGLDCKY